MKQATMRDIPEPLPSEDGALFKPVLVTHTAPNIKPLHSVWAWQERGKCREAANELFFLDDGEKGAVKRRKIELAKRVCKACPVINECTQHALSLPEPYGVWGGMSEEDRKKMVKRGRKTA